MNNNYSALTLIVDRSNSMDAYTNKLKQNIKSFIEQQKKIEEKAFLTINQFNQECESIYDFQNLRWVDVNKFSKLYKPQGNTALWDAIGRTAVNLQNKIDQTAKENKPKRVVVAIITDGEDNFSKEYTCEKVSELILEKIKLGWDFLYLGTSMDALDQAKKIGIPFTKAAIFDIRCLPAAIEIINNKFIEVRYNEPPFFSHEERRAMVAHNFFTDCNFDWACIIN